MAALGGDGGGLHAGRSAADHHDLPPDLRRCQRAVGELAASLGMLDAGDGEADLHMPDAGLVAGDAGADVVAAICPRLRRHLGIADHRAGHAAHIGGAVGDDALGFLRLIDAAGDEDRLAQALLQLHGA